MASYEYREKVKLKRYKAQQERCVEKGICLRCDNKLAPTSKVYCENHLQICRDKYHNKPKVSPRYTGQARTKSLFFKQLTPAGENI